MNKIEHIAFEMQTQNNRSTSYPIFIVVEKKKVYGIDGAYDYDGRERQSDVDADDLCETCRAAYEETGFIPEECDETECDSTFVNYRIEEDVPNLHAAFFFTAKACDQHIEQNRHHYNETAHSYAISAYHNHELQEVMTHINPPKTPF